MQTLPAWQSSTTHCKGNATTIQYWHISPKYRSTMKSHHGLSTSKEQWDSKLSLPQLASARILFVSYHLNNLRPALKVGSFTKVAGSSPLQLSTSQSHYRISQKEWQFRISKKIMHQNRFTHGLESKLPGPVCHRPWIWNGLWQVCNHKLNRWLQWIAWVNCPHQFAPSFLCRLYTEKPQPGWL